MRHLILGAALVAMAPAAAMAKTVRCDITSNEGRYAGPCRFTAEAGGSFSVDPVGRRTIVGDILSVGVTVTAPGEAQVAGLTRGGVSSRWGAASRSRRDPACWIGADFRVCAR